MRTGEKYPTVLIIYGGPEVQLVTNNFKGMRCDTEHVITLSIYNCDSIVKL